MTKQKKEYLKSKTNSVKLNEKPRLEKKNAKRNEQSLQEMWDYVKRPNLRLIGVPEGEEENESKLEILFRTSSRKTSPT